MAGCLVGDLIDVVASLSIISKSSSSDDTVNRSILGDLRGARVAGLRLDMGPA